MPPPSPRKFDTAIWCGIAVVLTVIAMHWVHPEYINPDTAQHVSVARSLVDGNGFTTSILYYEEQYAFGTLPAPQTLWPPGYPVLVASLMLLGVPEVTAAFALAVLGHLCVALLIFAIAMEMKLTRRWAAVLAASWFAIMAPAMLPLMAFTEPVFTALTLASVLASGRALTRSEGRSGFLWFGLSGVAAAAAFSIRYTGALFIAAMGALLLVRWLRTRTWRRFCEGLCFSVIPVLLCAAVLLRNVLLTGAVTGGPAVATNAGVLATIKALYWAALGSLGVFEPGWEYALTELLLLASGAIAVALALTLVPHGDYRLRLPRFVILLTAVYAGTTSALLVMMALERDPELIQWRYIVPLLPFGLLSVAAACQSPWLRDRVRPSRVAVACLFAATGVMLLVSQRHVVEKWDTQYVKASLARELATILDERIDGYTLQEVLDREGGRRTPVLTQDGQVLGALLKQPVLGTASPYYTSRIWSEREIADLVRSYQVGWVLVLPQFLEPTGGNDSNKVFFHDLVRGQVPPWLRLEHRTPQLELYSVVRERLSGSQVHGAEAIQRSVDPPYRSSAERSAIICSHCAAAAATMSMGPDAVSQ